jgi:hypothetical protein
MWNLLPHLFNFWLDQPKSLSQHHDW